MTPDDLKPEILQVDATIELKVYFHAYFDLVKTQLIIACLIVAALIGAFTYFFILIGEQKILLQLSPLFFGVPIVVVVGQFLRVHASYRKYIKDLSDSEKNIHYLFHKNGDGFDIVSGKSFRHIAWDDVRNVIERPQYFRFVFNKYDSMIMPKRFLSRGSDAETLKEIIISQVGSKAKLLGSSS